MQNTRWYGARDRVPSRTKYKTQQVICKPGLHFYISSCHLMAKFWCNPRAKFAGDSRLKLEREAWCPHATTDTNRWRFCTSYHLVEFEWLEFKRMTGRSPSLEDRSVHHALLSRRPTSNLNDIAWMVGNSRADIISGRNVPVFGRFGSAVA